MKKNNSCVVLFAVLVLGVFGAVSAADTCPIGDLSGDCFVDWQDLGIFVQFWLENPDGAANLDGVGGVNLADFAILANNWLKLPAQLVINEFMAKNDSFIRDPAGDYEDWIEIYNAGETSVDMAGMYLTDDLDAPIIDWWRIPSGDPCATTVQPGGYLLIWADDEAGEGLLHASFKLSAGGGEDIGLFESDGVTVIDSVSSFAAQGSDESYGRYPDGNDNWQVFGAGNPPTPGVSNGNSLSDVIINEIMYHPYHLTDAAEDLSLEYIELYNCGGGTANLAGCRLSGGVEFVFEGLTIPAGGYLVVAADVNAFTGKYPEAANVVGGWEGHLSNSGETLELIGPAGQSIDHVEYADEGDWVVRELGPVDYQHRGWIWSDAHDGGGSSLELINPSVSNTYGQNWAASAAGDGTPGIQNTVFANNIAPLILDVEHLPVVPASDEPVAVTAKIVDELNSGVTARIYYRVDGAGSFITAQMFDDGTHFDGAAGDGVYGVQLPAQSNGTIVEFYIEAEDSSALLRTWPAACVVDGVPSQAANMLYQVDDNFEPNLPAGSHPIYYIVMTEASRVELADIGDDGDPFYGEARSDAQMNATFISVAGADIKVRYNVGVRNRGNRTRVGLPNNYRINFASDRPWNGLNAMNINSRFTYVQLIGSVLWQTAGLATAEAAAVRVRVNGQDLAEPGAYMYGSYVTIEAFDSDFASNHFPNDSAGNLYSCNYYVQQNQPTVYADLTYRGTNPASYFNNYIKQTNESAYDWSDIMNLTHILNDSSLSDAEFMAQVREVVDVEQWMRFLAVDVLAGNREGGLTTGRGDDYAMYRGVDDPRFRLMPHDLDTILGEGLAPEPWRDIFVYTGVGGLRLLLNNPEAVRIYYGQLLELSETVFKAKNFNPLIERHLGGWAPQATIDAMKQFAANRIVGVLNQIPRDLTVTSTLPTLDGYYMNTDGASVMLSGQFPAALTASVMVNGVEATIVPIGATWSLDYLTGLKPGINRVVIQAFDGPAGGGEEVDRTYADILYDASGQSVIAVLNIPAGSQWKYLDNGSNQGTTWRELNFPDGTWNSGYAQFGYGDGDETTVVSYGSNPDNKYITTYFRRKFTIAEGEAAVFDELTVRLLRDDGAVVYLNGQEIIRQYVPAGQTYLTQASRTSANADEDTFYEFVIDPAVLVDGENILAVEIHQDRVTSSDISFDLELMARGFEGEGGGGGGTLSGTLAVNTLLDADSGPWFVQGSVTVPAGVTLEIEAGTTLFFESGARIVVNGRLVAQGSEYQSIRFTRELGTGTNTVWNGLQFGNTMADNRIVYAVIEYGRTDSGMIGLTNSNLLLENSTLDHTDYRRIVNIDSSLAVRNCVFTDLFAPGQPPTFDNHNEHIWGHGIPLTGHFIIEGNIFGTTKGHSDSIDFDALIRPNPIAQILNNIFTGGGDDALDFEGDAHIEGNVFMNLRKDQYNTAAGESNVLSAGAAKYFVFVRNVIRNVDHAVQVKDGAYLEFVNNTVTDVIHSAIYFGAGDAGPGYGAYVDGSIFKDANAIFDTSRGPTELSAHRSILTSELLGMGVGNIAEEPRLADVAGGDFNLLPGSPALGTGPNGQDMGAMIPAGASISGEPAVMTHLTTATLTVGGAGITHYRYSVNDGGWSDEYQVEEPIALTALTDGEYTVSVIGKNSAGVWQSEAEAASKNWTVDTSLSRVLINEVLAVNVSAAEYFGAFPDIIELYNDGGATVNLGGMSISDNRDEPRKYVFPSGTEIPAGGYLVLYADHNITAPGLHMDFALDNDGEGVFLYDTFANGGALLDEAEFGVQAADLSIGRVGQQRLWCLTQPSPGADNVAARTGDAAKLKINEWLADGDFEDDFIELYNGDTLPVALEGLYITDSAAAEPNRYCVKPLSFIAGGGHAIFIANNDGEETKNHLNFALSASGEMLGLFDADLKPIDMVIYYCQKTNTSEGRSPDGSDSFAFFEIPSPGQTNPGN